METHDNSQEQKFYNEFKKFLHDNNLNNKYNIIQEARLSNYITDTPIRKKIVDFMILKGNYPFMIVEIKNNSSIKRIARELHQSLLIELELTGADYYIVTNLTELVIIERNSEILINAQEFDDIFNYFDKELNKDDIERLKSKIVRDIKEAIEPVSQEIASIKSTRSFLLESDLHQMISYNSDGRFFHFANNPELGLEDFENKLFTTLLGPAEEQIVCRYTTFDSLYHLINNQSYRMASDVAMNDKSEIDYADKYINLYYTPFHSLSQAEMRTLNSSFISSCTTIKKKDDLTMYRLYAEDSKGVCLIFNVSHDVKSKYMLVQKISYARGINNHPELDLIKNMIAKINNKSLIRFRLLYMDIWKHFFKTHDYAIEEEVRLLYIDNAAYPPNSKGWVIANPDKILSKYVIFDINNPDFPLKLSKVILGPNCPESQLNKRQIEVLIDEKSMTNVTVENSKIESYRKS